MLAPDRLSGSCFYFIKSKKTEFMSGVWLCGAESPGAIARGRSNTQNTEGNNISHYSVQTMCDLSNINDLIIGTRGQEETTVTQQK